MNINSNKEKVAIMNYWYEHDETGNSPIQKLVRKQIKILGGFSNKDEDDFMSLANIVFFDSIKKWDSSKGNFKNFFKSNFNRKLITALRDANRLKVGGNGGIQFQSKYNDESDPTGRLRYNERNRYDNKRRVTVSLDFMDEEGVSLYDVVNGGDNISDYIENKDVIDDDAVLKFLNSCSLGQRKILKARIENPDFSMEQISKLLNIPVKKCREQILDIKRNPNINILYKKIGIQ